MWCMAIKWNYIICMWGDSIFRIQQSHLPGYIMSVSHSTRIQWLCFREHHGVCLRCTFPLCRHRPVHPSWYAMWCVVQSWTKRGAEVWFDHQPSAGLFTTVGLSLCWALNDTTSLQSLSLDLLNKMATSLAQNKTLKRLELRSDGLTQYNDAKLFTQHLMLGAAESTTLTGVCIGFSSWWRDCHIQSECAFLSCIVTVCHLHSLCWSGWCVHVTFGSLPVQWWDTIIFVTLSYTCTDKTQWCRYSSKTI